MQPLAEPDSDLLFWRRVHVTGLALMLLLPALGIVHAVLDPGQANLGPLVILLSAVMALVPVFRRVPVERLMRHPRGRVFFDAWEAFGIIIVTVVAALDGGADSPYRTAYFVLLVHAALAFQMRALLMIGSFTLASFVGLALMCGDDLADILYVSATLLMTTVTCAIGASNYMQANRRATDRVRRVQALVDLDGLSGCLNNRAWHERLEDTAKDATGERPVSVLFADVDDFKAVNDTYGHQHGDQVIAAIGRALLDVSRSSDVAGRLGGDEFALLMPATQPQGAEHVASRLREALRHEPATRGVTVSVGVASSVGGVSGTDLVASADRAAYEAKRAGKDTAVCAAPLAGA